MSQEKLYRQFYPGLFSLCRKFFDEEHDILTALNNGMLSVFKNIDKYDNSKGTLFTWAYRIILNSALNHLKSISKQNIHVELNEFHLENAPSYNPFMTLEWKDIYYFLGKLPPSTRAVCTLFYMEGFLIKEIAIEMQLSEGTVKWHLNEGRVALKKIMTKKDIF